MSIGYSNKVILITEKTRIAAPVKIALNKLDYEVASGYPALTSISVMRTGISHSGKTAFIRTELLRFINEKGFPRAIIMDSQIDLGMAPALDPGMLKIFKTLLISYIILSKGAECKDLRGNFILLNKGAAFEKEFGIGKNPHSVIKLLSTQNPEINYFIDDLKENRERFDALFSITLLDTEQPSDIITGTVGDFLVKNAGGAAAKKPAPAEMPGTAVKTDDTPARIVFRIDAGSVYDDGSITTELSEEHASLREREFYIIGSWSSRTELEVAKKIAGVLQKGINEQARFGYGDPIRFNLDDRCVMDKNTALSMAQLFKKNLAQFKKIAITASAKNGALIQKSRGFPMIKDILTVTPEAS
ncbi:MAG: hypothetical protein CVV44_16075 [Spirochaetae bacterium HGW-Spirochaetae-1]|jgi:hypothetical protein|nr:MAG: hypothetical protein CVV44_16075 [Spirochaetae bacterium HGW-Spirochaetae-1]